MKYFNKTMAAAIIAGAMSLTSCVDNEVAPEVKQMREAQAAYMSAKANLEAARAEQQRIQNEYNEANYAITLKTSEATLALRIAQVEQDVAIAQTRLQDEQLKLAKAVAAYEKYLNEQGLTDAVTYLNEYKLAVTELNRLAGERITAKAAVAIEEAVLASINTPWTIQNSIQQQKLKSANNVLAAQEASLEVYQKVEADAGSVEKEAAELSVRISELNAIESKLTLDESKAQAAVDAAEALMVKENAEVIIEEYEALQAEYKEEEDADKKAELKKEIDAKKSAYDEAVALVADYDKKVEALEKIQDADAANSAMRTSLRATLNNIETYLEEISDVISDLLEDIEETQASIVKIERNIAAESVGKEEQEAEVAKKKATLESVEAQYTAQESVVAKYKALLDAAVAN